MSQKHKGAMFRISNLKRCHAGSGRGAGYAPYLELTRTSVQVQWSA
jgi:hypothetical protein